MKQRIVCLLSVLLLLILSMSGCGQQAATVEYNEGAVPLLESQVLADNGQYSLSWDGENRCVIFENKATGKKWSNIPYDALTAANDNANLNSTLNITVVQYPSFQTSDVLGYSGAATDGRIASEKIENGVSVTYYFDQYKISVPVTYVLGQDRLEVSVDSAGIAEGDENYRLVSVSLAPFLCAANNGTAGAYLFIPSGTGALMYAANTAAGARKYSGAVYGEDPSEIVQVELYEKETVRMPIFGVKDGNDGLLGVISEDSIASGIAAEAGNERVGYSSVYPVFYYRGGDTLSENSWTHDYTRYSEDRAEGEAKVTYFALDGEQADYSGMALKYREYLNDSGALKQTEAEQKSYALTFVGGAKSTVLKLGFQKSKFLPATTYSQAKEIIEDLYADSGALPSVRLVGFGESGTSVGAIADGYSFSSALGNEKQRLELENYCEQQEIDLYTDFDLIRFSGSGNGFSYNFDAAKTPILKRAELYGVNIPVRSFNADIAYRLLKRSKVSSAVDKLIKFADKNGVKGVSLSSITSIAYSDYDESKYFSKGNMASDVREFLNQISAANHRIAASGANSYAANISNAVYDVTLSHGDNFAFDEQVPVYQMIYSGSKAMYSKAVNLSSAPQKEIVYAVATGMGVGFTVINDYHVEYTKTDREQLYAALYEDNRTLITDMLARYGEVYEKIAGASITHYECDENGLSVTEFDNGVTLYANHSDQAVDSPVGKLEAYAAAF